MTNANALHTFGPVEIDVDGLHTMTCTECAVSVGGDKPSDLYDVDDWAGECVPVVARLDAYLGDDAPLTYNPFSVLA